jgi:hypothetical protein
VHVLPGWEWIAHIARKLRIEAALVPDETIVKHCTNGIFGQTRTDKDQFLAAVTPDGAPVSIEQGAELGVTRPVRPRDGNPPQAFCLGAALYAGYGKQSDPVGPGGQPEMAFRADEAGPFLRKEILELGRVEGAARTIDEAGNAIFLGLRYVVPQP